MTQPEIQPKMPVDLDHIREYIRNKMINYQPKRMTSADLATKINIPRGTIDNFFDNTTKRPSFDLVCSMILAVGGSVDEALGLVSYESSPAHAVPDSAVKRIADEFVREIHAVHAGTIAAKSETIAELHAELDAAREETKKLSRFHRLFIGENVVFAVLLSSLAVAWLVIRMIRG